MSFRIRPIREDRPSKPTFAKRALAAVGGIAQPVASLYMLVQRKHDVEREKRENHIGLLKRVLALLIGLLFAGLLLIGTLRVLLAMRVFSLSQLVSVAGAQLPTDENGYTNILLLGEGGSDHDGIDLTDTIMVASIDAKGNQGVVLFSLPRDMWILKTDKMGDGRINSLFRNYKGKLIAQGESHEQAEEDSLKQLGVEIGNLIDLPVHGTLRINFDGFVQAVDAIGGVDVVVPEDIVDPEYPGPNYTYETFSITAGPHHLDGATALKYARSRHSTSDFSRSARQQQIISAIVEKTKAGGMLTNVGKITELFGIVSQNFRSTLGSRELLSLAAMGKDLDKSKMVNLQLNDQNGLYNSFVQPGGFLYAPPRDQFEGASVLLPVSLPEYPVTWKQIVTLSHILFRNRGLFAHPASIAVLNAGAKEGAARKLGGELFRYDFNVTQTKNYPKGATPSKATSYISVRPVPDAKMDVPADTRAKAEMAHRTAEYLSGLLNLPLLEQADTTALADGDDLAVVLTGEYVYKPLQDILPAK